MNPTMTRAAAAYIVLILALAVGVALYLGTDAAGNSLNATGAVVVAASALLLSNKLWK